jgi:hypothetical protein
MLRVIKWLVVIWLIATAYSWLNFYLPHHDVVRIVGTDTKRLDSSGVFDSEAPNLQAKNSRDVRFINTVYPGDNDVVRVFRNEDTDWSFPWYYKFDSGNLQAEAQALTSSKDNPQWVVIRSYGWRIPYLTMFPNALSMRRASGPDETIIPWFNIIFLSGCALILVWIYLLLRRFKRRRIDPLFAQVGQHADEAMEAIDRQTTAVTTSASDMRSGFSRWLDTWKKKKRR